MNTSLSFPLSSRLAVIIGDRATIPRMLEAAAELALAGPLQVVDGGNCFNAYPVARHLRRRTAAVHAALGRIRLARAFTCYQMVTLLQNLQPGDQPVMALDLLQTFYDENVRMAESRRLLERCIVQLTRLSRAAPVLVSARPPAEVCATRLPLLHILQEAAEALYFAVESSSAAQPAPLPLPGMETSLGLTEG